MSDAAERAAWADYWTSAGGARPSCLPNAESGIDVARREIWTAFARTLRRRARVLDIGTGDGAVLAILSARHDLDLTGVDNAPALPRAPKNVRLRANVAAEQLPFADGCLDAVVSQFGFEYADIALAAQEIGRVLRDGGAVHMIVHHRGGPIVAHNRIRRAALHWLADEQDLIGQARALIAARQIASLPTPVGFRAAVSEARARYGPGSGADELAEAIWQTLEFGRGRAASGVAAMLGTLEGRAKAEIVRINGLLRAACDENEIGRLAGQLRAAGIDLIAPRPLFEAGASQPFAWLIDGRKREAVPSRSA